MTFLLRTMADTSHSTNLYVVIPSNTLPLTLDFTLMPIASLPIIFCFPEPVLSLTFESTVGILTWFTCSSVLL